MVVSLGSEVLSRYRRFTLYNSPYVAHDAGCAIDLYPDSAWAPSPVAGDVLETRTVKAPPQPYAVEHDHLILIDTGRHVARILHVDPAVEAGETVAVGDSLGTLVRAGFFAPWVPNHIHLGFRDPAANPYRAAGSVRIELDVDIIGCDWDGTGTVMETGETWARLDQPSHPASGNNFAGLASDGGILDGGFPHYDGGGLLGDGSRAVVAGTEVGAVSGRDVTWSDVTVGYSLREDSTDMQAEPAEQWKQIRGIALYCARDSFGIKLVGRDLDLHVGDEVILDIREHDDQ